MTAVSRVGRENSETVAKQKQLSSACVYSMSATHAQKTIVLFLFMRFVQKYVQDMSKLIAQELIQGHCLSAKKVTVYIFLRLHLKAVIVHDCKT